MEDRDVFVNSVVAHVAHVAGYIDVLEGRVKIGDWYHKHFFTEQQHKTVAHVYIYGLSLPECLQFLVDSPEVSDIEKVPYTASVGNTWVDQTYEIATELLTGELTAAFMGKNRPRALVEVKVWPNSTWRQLWFGDDGPTLMLPEGDFWYVYRDKIHFRDGLIVGGQFEEPLVENLVDLVEGGRPLYRVRYMQSGAAGMCATLRELLDWGVRVHKFNPDRHKNLVNCLPLLQGFVKVRS